jgi:AraC-like DNA-binding protein
MPAVLPHQHRIPASYGLTLLSLMTERGHPDERVLQGSGLQRASLIDQNARIEGWQYGVMLGNALRLDPQGGIPYELGLRSQVTKHGFVGFGLMSCATLRDAISFSARYFKARVPVFRSHMRLQGEVAIVDLEETVPLGPLRGAIFDIVLVELCSLFAKVLELDVPLNGWSSEIWVTHAQPEAYARYRNRLPPFRFGQAANQIRFPACRLDEAIPSADPVSVQLAIDRCEQELAMRAAANSVVEAVRARLVSQNGVYPDVATMAQALLLSERTLKRRLQDEGSTFQMLLDEARLHDALRLLARPELAIKEVAQAVGYADPANFARAFTRWTGESPRDWRKRQGL